MNMKSLTRQALERWSYVPRAERLELLEELATKPPGTACIELKEPFTAPWPDRGYRVKASVVNLTFGTDTSMPRRRYLLKSDIPPEPAD